MKNDTQFDPADEADSGLQGAGFPAIQDGGSGLVFAPGPNHDTRLSELLAAIEKNRNPFLEAGSVLLRSLAELPKELNAEGVRGLHTLLTQELQPLEQPAAQDLQLPLAFGLKRAPWPLFFMTSFATAGRQAPWLCGASCPATATFCATTPQPRKRKTGKTG